LYPPRSILRLSLLRLRRRIVSLLKSSLGRRLDLRQSAARIQCRPVFLHRALAVFLHIQNPAKINMRPSHHLRIFRSFDRSLEIILRSIPILVGHGHFRQDKQRPPLVADFLIQSLLRQFLRAFRIARRQSLLRRKQDAPLLGTRQLY